MLSLGISSRGDVKGCLAQPDDFIEGNIRERNIIDIWQDPDAFSHIRKFKTSDLKGFCRDCPYGATCKGGCTSFGYAVTGEFYHNPYCLYRMEQLGLIPNDAVSRP